jgi:hypothetical protein
MRAHLGGKKGARLTAGPFYFGAMLLLSALGGPAFAAEPAQLPPTQALDAPVYYPGTATHSGIHNEALPGTFADEAALIEALKQAHLKHYPKRANHAPVAAADLKVESFDLVAKDGHSVKVLQTESQAFENFKGGTMAYFKSEAGKWRCLGSFWGQALRAGPLNPGDPEPSFGFLLQASEEVSWKVGQGLAVLYVEQDGALREMLSFDNSWLKEPRIYLRGPAALHLAGKVQASGIFNEDLTFEAAAWKVQEATCMENAQPCGGYPGPPAMEWPGGAEPPLSFGTKFSRFWGGQHLKFRR